MNSDRRQRRQFAVVTGTGPRDANPQPLGVSTFGEFVATYLQVPVVCHLDSDAYAALPDPQKREAKATGYFCAAIFGGDGRRNNTNVTHCSMVVLDVDEAEHARTLLDAPLEDILPWNFALWTTLTSTPAAPRVRLVVESIPLSGGEYRKAVAVLAARLGVEYDPVSTDPSHLWYRPTVFADRAESTPMVATRTTGPAYDPVGDIEPADPEGDALPVPVAGDVTLDDARSMLRVLDPDDPPYWGWVKPLMALRHQFGGGEEVFELWDQWSRDGAKYPGEEASRAKWESFAAAPKTSDPVTIRTLIALARKEGWTPKGSKSLANLEKVIAEAKDLTELTGPCLRAVHSSVMLSKLEVDVLLARIQTRARALKAPLRLASIKEAMDALDPSPEGRGVVPAPLQGFVFVREPNLWINPARGTRITPQAFDLGFSSVALPEESGRLSTYALQRLALPAVDREVYEPRRPTDLIYTEDSGLEVLNTYRQSHPEADPTHADEAGAILDAHLALLFPDQRHQDLLRSWMGWCLRNPGEKAKWHVFIQGTQGCGKSLLAEALAIVFGPTNSRKVSPTMITEKFNSWVQNTCFAYFEEVLIGERQRDTMEMIKDLVTGSTTNIRAMRADAVERPNHLNGMFLSNHLHGLRLERADRRFFCLCCAQQTETDAKQIPREYFVQLARLKGDLAGGLRHYLLHCPLSNEFDPHGHAPHTEHRELVMRAGASEIDHAITAAIEGNEHPLVAKDVVSSSALQSMVRGEVRGVTVKQINRVLQEMGYRKVGQRLLKNNERHLLWEHPERLAHGRTATEAANIHLMIAEID